MEQTEIGEMNQYTVMNILDLIDSVGEDEVQRGLSAFLFFFIISLYYFRYKII